MAGGDCDGDGDDDDDGDGDGDGDCYEQPDQDKFQK